jgi:hypothetical protein
MLIKQMAQILVRKNKEMKDRAASTKSINLRQATMTQEFDAVADRSENLEPLPPGWIRIWDNPGGRYYFFNTVDHDIQHNLTRVHAKVALNALNVTRAEVEEDLQEIDDDVPDPVGSASRNVIISPSPVKSSVKSEFVDKKRKTAPKTTYGGTVDMSLFYSSDEEVCVLEKENEEEKSSSDSSTDCGDSRKPAASAPVYRGAYKKVKKNVKKRKVERKLKVPPRPYSDGSSDIDESIDSIDTQELINTQDFGGAEALVNLQTEPTNFGEQEAGEASGEDDDNDSDESN